MRKIFSVLSLFFTIIFLCSCTTVGGLTDENIEKLNTIMGVLREESIYKLDDDKLLELALKGMVGIDRYSRYLTVEEFVTSQERISSPGTTVGNYLGNGIGYVYVSSFNEGTADEFNKIIKFLQDQGLRGLVFDLRSNTGGLVNTMLQVASTIMGQGKIVCGEMKGNGSKYVYVTDPSSVGIKVPIVVLVNNDSASATEILVASLQDNNAVVVLGEKTFGKGIGQKFVPLEDGSAVKFTSSIYFRPNGTEIHEVGITPDLLFDEKNNNLSVGGKITDKTNKEDDPWLFEAIMVLLSLLQSLQD